MPMEDVSILQASDAVTSPVPSADPARMARWLERVRVGALCGLGVAICWAARDAANTVLWVAGITPWPRVWHVILCVMCIGECVAGWLLVSSEPCNFRWLWPCRWILRLAAAAFVFVCGARIVFYAFGGNLPEQWANVRAWPDLILCGMIAGWLLLNWYLKALSHRLGDVALRRNFNLLVWLLGIILLLGLLAVTCKGRPDHGPVQSASAPAPAEAKTRFTGVPGPLLVVSMALHAWMGWLMWRLSRRLKRSAGHYRSLHRLLAAAEPQRL